MASAADYLRDLAGLGYSFRYNDVTDRIEVNGDPLSDVLEAKIRAEMRDRRHKQMKAVEDAYTAAAWGNRYHPIRDYLTSLTWDGGGHIAALAQYFTDRYDVFGLYLRRWLIGAVAKAFLDGQVVNFMLVLDGPQYSGKSQFVAWLCPPTLAAYQTAGKVNPDNKDIWILLANKWLWEVGELGATVRTADREALKDFISHLRVTFRLPYGKHSVTRPALASLIGTVNGASGSLLNDPTGSRRFAVCELKTIDWQGYTAAIDVNQVWAEAFTAYQAGERWELTGAEYVRQLAINEEYEVEVPLEGLLHRYYAIDPNDATHWTPGIEIVTDLEVMGLKGLQHRSLSELGAIMKRQGVLRERRNRTWGYVGVARRQGVGP